MMNPAYSSGLPVKPALEGLEGKWEQVWREDGTLRIPASRLP